MIRITDIKISLRHDEKLKAFATLTLDHCFVVRGLKVIQTGRGMFVAMPARRKPDGKFQDVAHPINVDARAYVEGVVLQAYKQALEAGGDGGPTVDRADDEDVDDSD